VGTTRSNREYSTVSHTEVSAALLKTIWGAGGDALIMDELHLYTAHCASKNQEIRKLVKSQPLLPKIGSST
jgi:hypothetical protein